MSAKRILYVEGNIDGTIGGSYYSLLYLTSGLDHKKYKPIVVFYRENALIPTYNSLGVETAVFQRPTPFVFKKYLSFKNPVVKTMYPLLRVIQKLVNFYLFFIATSLEYSKFIKKNNIEMVHLNNAISRGDDWKLATVLAGIKCVCHERGINLSYPKLSLIMSRKLSAIFCISSAVHDNMLSQGFKPGLLRLVHNGIDPEKVIVDTPRSEMLKRHNLTDDQILIGMVGNIKKWKGQEVVIKALKKVVDRYPNVRCLFVGDVSPFDENYYNHLRSLVKEFNIENNVLFTGYQKNVANYLNVMKVVIHASTDPEPFGRVLIEAMSMRKPLVGSGAGAVPERIAHGVTGYVFEPANSIDLSEKLLDLLDNEERAANMGEAGFNRLQERFHINNNVKKIQLIYDEIFSR